MFCFSDLDYSIKAVKLILSKQVGIKEMINLSVKSKYAITAVFDLAINAQAGPVQMKAIASRHQIPHSYLEQLMIELKKAGFIKSFRGAQGGYALSIDPEKILILDIIKVMDGDINFSDGHKGCQVLETFWTEIEAKIEAVFTTPISELISMKAKLDSSPMYQI